MATCKHKIIHVSAEMSYASLQEICIKCSKCMEPLKIYSRRKVADIILAHFLKHDDK